MSVVARRINSVPVRYASETWKRIVDLIAPTNATSRAELLAVTGVAASLITRESLKDSPFVVAGDGARVRVYCVYGDDSIEGTKASEAAVPNSPAETDTWMASLPCPKDDLAWVQAQLAQHSSRITARDMAEAAFADEEEKAAAATPTINVEAFLRP